MIKRLRLKFVCINMSIVLVMLCVIFGMVLYFTSRSLEDQSIQMMQSVAANPIQPGRPGEQSEDVRLPYFVLQISARGELIATGGGYFDLSDEEFLDEIMEVAFSSEQQVGTVERYNLRYYRKATPMSQCLVFADITSERNTLQDLTKTCILIGVLSFLVFLCVSLLLARWAVKPVDRAWTQQKQFVSDASHELKTPLTVILTNAEQLQDPAYDDATRVQFSDNILTMARQMRNLVENLLDLARVDNGTMKMTFVPIDFSLLISDALLPFEPVYFERGLQLQSQIADHIVIKGSAQHLQQVVDILLDNAMKYSSPAATIWVCLQRQGSGCLLTVANPGAPISREDLENIFKRFYRVDKARSTNGSYGLGLPIARSIIREHRGKLWAQSSNGINTFCVQLPTG